MTETKRPKARSESEKELDRAEAQFTHFEEQVKDLTLDNMNKAPKREEEPQTKLSQSEIEKSKEIYLKPERSIKGADKFNEKYRSDYEFQKEYVHFIAENKEIIGETIEIWTKPFAGMPAEFWKVPTNKPLWGPRYLAEQISRKNYHRLKLDQKRSIGSDGLGEFFGSMVANETIERLSAKPALKNKSIFMGAKTFS